MSPDYLSISFPPLEEFYSPLLLRGFGIEEFLLIFFTGIGIFMLACQLVPGILLLISMVRSTVACIRDDTEPSVEAGH